MKLILLDSCTAVDPGEVQAITRSGGPMETSYTRVYLRKRESFLVVEKSVAEVLALVNQGRNSVISR